MSHIENTLKTVSTYLKSAVSCMKLGDYTGVSMYLGGAIELMHEDKVKKVLKNYSIDVPTLLNCKNENQQELIKNLEGILDFYSIPHGKETLVLPEGVKLNLENPKEN